MERTSRLLAGLSLLLVACTGTDATGDGSGVVDWVVDGDTIDVVIDDRHERVRLIGIDTPELHVPDGEPECYGSEAATFTTRLVPPGTEVRLERDVVGRDDYGRLLAYVYVDDVMVNEELARQGMAQPLSIEPNVTYARRFAAAARAAEAADLGLWGACTG